MYDLFFNFIYGNISNYTLFFQHKQTHPRQVLASFIILISCKTNVAFAIFSCNREVSSISAHFYRDLRNLECTNDALLQRQKALMSMYHGAGLVLNNSHLLIFNNLTH